jgi:hypothetical protein
VLNEGDAGVEDSEFRGTLDEAFVDGIEFVSVSDLVAEDVSDLVEGDVDEHIVVVVFSVLVADAEVDYLLVERVALATLTEGHVLDVGMDGGDESFDLHDLWFGLVHIFLDLNSNHDEHDNEHDKCYSNCYFTGHL